MLVSTIRNPDALREVYQYQKKERKGNFFNKVFSRVGLPVTSDQRRLYYLKNSNGKYEIISFPFSDYDITKSKEFIEADLINLHWIAGYLDYKSFFKKCRKPIVFTLRDLYPLQGIFHYEEDKERNVLNLGEIDKKLFKLKVESINGSKSKIEIVGISKWMTEKSKKSDMFKGFHHNTIHNCINTENYEIIPKSIARILLNIPDHHIVLSFISDLNSSPRKGLDIFVEAISSLPYYKDLTILTIGNGCTMKFPLSIVHRHLGPCNQKEINMVFCASDAFIFPSREEALGNVMLESMACGTPVIGTPVGGLLDVIQPEFNGLISDGVTASGLAKTISEFIAKKNLFNSYRIRDYIEKNFSEDLIANQYIEIYKSLLNR